MGELLLVGVVHRDPHGALRLGRLLERERPTAVGLELAEPSVRLRRERGPALRARLFEGLRALGEQALADAAERGEPVGGPVGELLAALELPYELTAAEEYCRASGATLGLLDEPELAAKAVEVFESELFTPENLRGLLEQERRAPRAGDAVEEQYRMARRYFGAPGFFRHHFGPAEAAQLERRDAYASRGLEGLLAEADKVVYVAGWEHLVDAGLKTMYSLWKGRARRVLLSDG